ncbi:MAG TPA: radical SAM protein [Myxococcales bacterium]|nr:radical SAM protein [Myxococcales bacterium]
MDLLDLVLLYDCNLKCSYCTITNEMRARTELKTAEVAGQIVNASQRGCTSLSITGGEPTLRSDLLPIIRHARAHAFTDIKIQTNGLVFAHNLNLEKAVDAGLTRVGVSVHGFSPNDSLAYENSARAEPGTQQLMLQAIDNLVAASVSLTVDLILMTSTQSTVFGALKALHERGVNAFNLWLVSLTDNNAENLDSLPRITKLLPIVTQCLDYGKSHKIKVESLHIPRCLLPEHLTQVNHPGVGKEVKVVTPDAVFELKRSVLSGGVKSERCKECSYDDSCPGLRADYVAQFGDEELQPLIVDR